MSQRNRAFYLEAITKKSINGSLSWTRMSSFANKDSEIADLPSHELVIVAQSNELPVVTLTILFMHRIGLHGP
jgi:hypothetical protein